MAKFPALATLTTLGTKRPGMPEERRPAFGLEPLIGSHSHDELCASGALGRKGSILPGAF
jgi:hypothetical protein